MEHSEKEKLRHDPQTTEKVDVLQASANDLMATNLETHGSTLIGKPYEHLDDDPDTEANPGQSAIIALNNEEKQDRLWTD